MANGTQQSIRDDAGEIVPLLVEKNFQVRKFFAVELPFVARTEEWFRWGHVTMIMSLGFIFVSMVCVMALANWFFAAMLVALAAYGLTREIHGRYFRLLHLRELAELSLTQVRCASCGYSMRGHIENTDAELVTCPECGAKWLRERLVMQASVDARRDAAR